MSTIWTVYNIKKKDTLFRGKDSTKRFCESFSEHAKNIIGFEKKKNVTVNKRRIQMASRCKNMLHLGKRILKKLTKSINYH